MTRRQRLHKMHIERNEYRDARRGDTRNLFKADTLVAQLAVSKLLFGRRLLSQMGNCMRVGRLLCKPQKKDQQAIKDPMPFHGYGSILASVAPCAWFRQPNVVSMKPKLEI